MVLNKTLDTVNSVKQYFPTTDNILKDSQI